MIKIVLTDKEKLALEVGYLTTFCNKTHNPAKKYNLDYLTSNYNYNELVDFKEKAPLERLLNVYQKQKKEIDKNKISGKYILRPDFPLESKSFFLEVLLIDPDIILNNDYNQISEVVHEKIKTITDIIILQNEKPRTFAKLHKWISEKDHFISIKQFLEITFPSASNDIKSFDNYFSSQDHINELMTVCSEIRDYIDNVFDYNAMINSDSKYHYIISCLMKVSVCPYCNRQYISIFNDTKKGTATFDHCYREETYPIFKLSLYNLVPSCYTCNSTLKGSSDIQHLNPWNMKEANSLKFIVHKKNEGYDFLENYYSGYGSQPYLNSIIKIAPLNDDPNAKGSVDVFALEDMYQIHSKFAADFDTIVQKYETSSYKEMIIKLLNESDFEINENILDKILYGFQTNIIDNDESENHLTMNNPLSKLKLDILKKYKNK